ncbi:DPP IV N-terminal domain-containing protein [Sphingobacterium hungaricum]|uniref:TolB protein n=1 Tax=Sphingobacterium hungaricum TaxID=2082723 RepID=A0A928UXE5_9SPHI|nr:DPP IV N-terminal domain-containing protein [Sphingobacterium hungaricum]MBE8712339.1 tolB protein precursor [Sphingobacterium hungaricum]
MFTKACVSRFAKLLFLGLLFLSLPEFSSAQYFGQNKMRYRKLNFKVYDTPHFNLYYYLDNDSMVRWIAKESEIWYDMHQQVFQDTFSRKNPIVLYSNHPEFQQTTTISGEIGVGTGGVTEAFKQRVVMPFMQINQQTRHVLGHELVHAFQYRVLMEGTDSTSLQNIGNVPLWMVEGMAEYFSIGNKDAFTSMWMRDAYANRDIPTLKQMTEQSYKYFPYRFGQSFWSYIGGTYGDTVIMPLFIETAKYGYEIAVKRVFGYDAATISTLWKNSLETTYKNLNKDTTSRPIGKALLTKANSGRMNVSPAISPDGKYVAFLSERDLFSIDLYLADAQTGTVVRKLGSRLTNKDIDEFSFLESAGTFSPDSKKFAFSVFNDGKNKLMTVDVATGKTLSVTAMGDINEFTNITWSPDGNLVAFSGLKNGHSDIYTYNLSAGELTQLTNDVYSDFQPSFSRNGKFIVFSTDRVALQSDFKSVDIPMNLAILDISTKAIENLSIFPGANNLNPHFSSNDESIYFLSNGDGFRNMYRYAINSKSVEKLTDYFTGISGITEYSPAMSISLNDEIVYSYFKNNEYQVYRADAAEFNPINVDPIATNFDAAILPPTSFRGVNVVNANLENFNEYERIDDVQITEIPYTPKFKLDYLANSGVGVSVGSRYGAGIASGIQGMFSDILGYNQIFAAVNINGGVYDFGAQLAYINQKSRFNWGFSVSHIPYLSAFNMYDYRDISGSGIEENVLDTYIMRTFMQQVEGFVAFPFNRHHRVEASAALERYSYRVDRWSQGYSTNYSTREKISNEEASEMLNINMDLNAKFLQKVGAGFVGDNSVFGIAAPLQGYRYRLGADQYFGDLNFTAVNLDLRKYNRYKPVTLAARFYSYMRVGQNEEGIYPLYIGYPHLVRGYSSGDFDTSGKITLSDLMGSRTAVANFEVRIPFTGPEKLAAIKSNFLFTDLNFFIDGGLAWNGGDKIVGSVNDKPMIEATDSNGNVVVDDSGNPILEPDPTYRIPVFSAGVSLRVNLFGAMILEPFYAIPFQKSRAKFGTFGLNFTPGW